MTDTHEMKKLSESFDNHAKQDEERFDRIEKTLDRIEGKIDDAHEKIDDMNSKIEPILEIYQGFNFGKRAVFGTASLIGAATVIGGTLLWLYKQIFHA